MHTQRRRGHLLGLRPLYSVGLVYWTRKGESWVKDTGYRVKQKNKNMWFVKHLIGHVWETYTCLQSGGAEDTGAQASCYLGTPKSALCWPTGQKNRIRFQDIKLEESSRFPWIVSQKWRLFLHLIVSCSRLWISNTLQMLNI